MSPTTPTMLLLGLAIINSIELSLPPMTFWSLEPTFQPSTYCTSPQASASLFLEPNLSIIVSMCLPSFHFHQSNFEIAFFIPPTGHGHVFLIWPYNSNKQ